MDELVENFIGFTSASEDVAKRYLAFADNNFEQAIQLFFDSPDLGAAPQAPRPPPVPKSTRPPRRAVSDGGSISDDDADMDYNEEDEGSRAAALGHAADVEDDEAMARRMQEELYAGGDGGAGYDADGVRAPIARTTETLVGGHDGGWNEDDDAHAEALRQFQMQRARAAGSSSRPGVFNQRPVPSIWDQSVDPDTRRQGMAEATGGDSETSSKAARLAELFRPPFELMRQVPFDVARESGKEEMKWIIVNVQDQSLFDCQRLNRDIWKHDGIKELIKENFVFVQYSKDDPRGMQYFQYYFSHRESSAAYPHIAIIDPRTGEQVKVWSGPPVPEASDFLMQLVEFLDRYSLDASKKNPVAKRKLEKPKSVDVNRLTEEEMLDLALQNSLATNGTPTGPKDSDPDELTKSFIDVSKGKEKDAGEESAAAEPSSSAIPADDSPFSRIAANNSHTEPPAGAGVTRIQFRHSNGRVVRRFNENDEVRRIFEWLKSEPLEGKAGITFDLRSMGTDLMEHLDETIKEAKLSNGTVMVEYIED